MNRVEKGKNPSHRVENLIKRTILLYRSDETEVHGQKHIRSCLRNLSAIKKSAFGLTITDKELDKARLAVAFHDVDRILGNATMIDIETIKRIGIDDYIKKQLVGLPLSDRDVDDILLAIQNHSKPKERWHDPNNLTSTMLYDADKMDTREERFFLDTKKEVVNADKYHGYVIMVRDSLTTSVAIEKINEQLPKELRINPNDQSKSAEDIKIFYQKMHQIWQVSSVPAKRIAAKYCLQCTSNVNFTNSIKKGLGERPNVELEQLSPLRRRLINRVGEMERFAQLAINNLDNLLLNVGKDVNQFSKEKLANSLSEKLFTYDMFTRSLINYPPEWESDLERMYFRNPKDLHKNYKEIKDRFGTDISELGEKFDERKDYFSRLVKDRLSKINHYARNNDFTSLISARRIIEREMKTILESSDSESLNLAIVKAVRNKGVKESYDILRFFSQESLRAVDRVNDVFGTDRFIYFLLENQVINAPVKRLPYIYKMDVDNIKDMQIIYSHPSHPQVIHLMKMHDVPDNTPEILTRSIRMFSHGLFSLEDFHNLYTDILALNFDTGEIDQKMFDFIFENIVVNEESILVENQSGTFSAPDWLEIDYQKREDPLWEGANQSVKKINKFCANKGIIPPLRPYVVVPKALEFSHDSVVIDNPILEKIN